MSLKDILVYLPPEDWGGRGHPGARYVIEMAARFGAHVTALVVDLEVETPVMLYQGGAVPDLEPLRQSYHAAALQEGEAFSEQARQAGVSFEIVTEKSFAHGVGEVIAELDPVIARSKLTVTPALPPEPTFVRSDRQKVKQILLNLLSNALKFTHRGGIRIARG